MDIKIFSKNSLQLLTKHTRCVIMQNKCVINTLPPMQVCVNENATQPAHPTQSGADIRLEIFIQWKKFPVCRSGIGMGVIGWAKMGQHVSCSET